jgi:hypothetical protein
MEALCNKRNDDFYTQPIPNTLHSYFTLESNCIAYILCSMESIAQKVGLLDSGFMDCKCVVKIWTKFSEK